MVDAFYGGLVVRAERKGGRGFGVRCRMEGKMGKREGGPGTAGGDSSAAGIGPQPAGLWHDRGGRRGTGDPTHARLTDGAERRRGLVGSGWVREGVRRSEAVAASGR
jgi:hypothetical protein